MNYKNVILVDTSNLLHRFHYANQELSVVREGKTISTGSMYGLCLYTQRVISQIPNTLIVFCMDSKSKARKEISEEYKENRVRKEEVYASIKHIVQVLGLVPHTCYAKVYDKEADDVIACLAFRFKNKNPDLNIIIHSNDNDFYQLIKYDINVANEFKGGKYKKITPNDVLLKYNVSLDCLLKYRVLVGDTSDNIKPVVPRMRKEFLKLLAEAWQQEGDIIKACNSLREGHGANVDKILDNLDRVETNMSLMTLEKYREPEHAFEVKLKRSSGDKPKQLVDYYELNEYKRYLREKGWY